MNKDGFIISEPPNTDLITVFYYGKQVGEHFNKLKGLIELRYNEIKLSSKTYWEYRKRIDEDLILKEMENNLYSFFNTCTAKIVICKRENLGEILLKLISENGVL